jgi:predicted signal transduction protein with EAL and GGDEF domain
MHKTRRALIGKNLWEEFPDAVSSEFYAECHRAVGEQKTVEFEDFYPPLNTWFGVRIYPSQDNLSVYLQDITERKSQSAALEHQATHDTLTDLPNRILLYDRLQQAILVGQRENKPLALLILDLDRFKQVNDTLGHQQGDILLKEMARRLRIVVRGSDTIARLGGDEFALIY